MCCGKGGVVLLHVDEPGGAASAYPYANQGRAFEYTLRRLSPPFSSGVLREGALSSPLARAPERRSLRVHPRSFYAHHLLHVDETGAQLPRESVIMYRPPSPPPSSTPAVILRPHSPPLRRASEGQRPESESKSLICEPPRGEAFEYVRRRIAPPFFRVYCGKGALSSPPYASQGAKPSSTPAIVLRPLFSSGVLRKRGEASAYTRRRIAPPIFFGCAAERGRSIRLPLREPRASLLVHPPSFIATISSPLRERAAT